MLVAVAGMTAPAVTWGRFATDRVAQECESWGAPDGVQRPGRPLEVRQASGLVNPGDRHVDNRYTVLVRGGPQAWGGMSGAGVFSGDVLIGVVAAHTSGDQLVVVPAYVLWADPGFRALVGADRLVGVEFDPLAMTSPDRVATPSALVLARHEIVPWQPRPELMAALHAWLSRPGPGVWLLHGPGGQGKTRLALQLGRELADWLVFWPAPEADPDALRVVADSRRPTLVVLDYAETRPKQLHALVRGNKVKLLLLARTDGEWWDSLPEIDDRVADSLAGATTHRLAPLTTTAGYRQVVTAYANALPRVDGFTTHPWPDIAAALPDRDDIDHALTLHLTALADLLDATAPPQRTTDHTAEARVLFHERRYWNKTAERIPALAALDRTTLHNAVTLLILAGLATPAEADPVLRTLPGLPTDPAPTIHALTRWFSTLYPPTAPDRAFDTPQPDRLAEHHAAHQVHTNPDLTTRLLTVATPAQAATLLVVLTRALSHTLHRESTAAHLTSLITAHPDILAQPALVLALAVESPTPFLAALRAIVLDPDTSTMTLFALGDALPESTQRLAHLAVDLCQRIVDECRVESNDNSPKVAMALSNLSTRLRWVGQWEQALTLISEAIGLFRNWVERGQVAHLGNLASCLNNFSAWAGESNMVEEGFRAIQEAVAIRRALSDVDRDGHLSLLAYNLNNFSNYLAMLDYKKEALAAAEEAVGLFRELVDREGDAHLRGLGVVLTTLSNRFGEVGRSSDGVSLALEAVTIYRELAENNIDALLPDLAKGLHNLGIRLGESGFPAEGLAVVSESSAIFRELADMHPQVYALEVEVSKELFDWLRELGDRGI
ncbi:tetratricopeptide repeat protein [Actinokineospora globicatena]|uniref:tetratricopeptide repeat protein n=1 Tax=Actinokineospora globicatena TaxID=103729 RepID=UPI002554DD3F|nr:tetratricopeptide repeat protein [Actinokineospora globicatena]